MSHLDWEEKNVPSRCILKPWGEAQRRQYLLAVDLGHYKWRCASLLALPRREVNTRRCANEDIGPQRGWIWGPSHIDWIKEWVPARTLVPKGGGLWCLTLVRDENKSPLYKGVDDVAAFSLFPEGGYVGSRRGGGLWCLGMSASEDAGPEWGWIVMSHIS